MDLNLFETAVITFVVGMFVIVATSTFNKIVGRIFPKYAVWLAVRKQAMIDKATEKDRASRARKKARMTAWAEAHPDAPIAQSYIDMAEEAPGDSSEVAGFDPAAEIAKQQAAADEQQRRFEQLLATERLENALKYEWACENPGDPIARRHLDEHLVKLQNELERQDHIAFMNAESNVYARNSPEAIAKATTHGEAMAKSEELRSEIAKIGKLLEGASISDQ